MDIKKTIYQIYPLSFKGSRGKGHGNIKGIIEKLDYIKKLSVDMIWISPITSSPMKDNGYDVSNYKNINPLFGNMNDFKTLVNKAKNLDMGIMMDIVMNHTSNEHEWFKKSINSIAPYDKYYVWRDKPIEKFNSQFQNSAWTYNKIRKQWYLHHFASEQPDLNWENDDLIEEFIGVINFWISHGVQGFRFDVIDMLGKQIDLGKTINIDRAYKIIKKIGLNTWLKNDLFTVGECWSTSRENVKKYVNKTNGLFTTAFNARYMFEGWFDSRWDLIPPKGKNFIEMKKWIFETRKRIEADCNIPNFIENHDFPRSISRLFSADGYEASKAKLILISFFGFNGHNFIYQGQELGLTNPIFDIKNYNDPETKKFINNKPINLNLSYRANAGTRDNARALIPWEYKKFKKSWLKFEYDDSVITQADQEKNLHSVLLFYKWFLKWKKCENKFFSKAKLIPMLIENEGIFAYKYKTKDKEIVFISNWSNKNVKINIKIGKVIIGEIENQWLSKYGYIITEINNTK
ncbi:alpha-amylase family glycosyl hydrolase [Candidatus Mycoplasma mahonii]|uniref:alpha-amylase family glycosyl hydrolase n=1 Tax=Candidatus Mycoplasma mahonii TaxID=3004105 RepID=UPI0026F23C90|nr:alpha-amylase family glycosyl hydrolase [Candidatus Mycoplasma mahonii]WKX02637.1 alpha-amylase family glycosyl hydrolase [Candidatus Mycoplasma mahonii]